MGIGTKKALEWHRKVAAGGYAQALQQFREPCHPGGLYRHRKAAEGGYADAQCKLGNIYKGGVIGAEVDMKEAPGWYRKAAEGGHPEAQCRLGKA